jgi:hypothetical protein
LSSGLKREIHSTCLTHFSFKNLESILSVLSTTFQLFVFASITSQLLQVLSNSQFSKTSELNIFWISSILSSREYNQFSLLDGLSHLLY